jgi:hypothetical protein
MVLGNKYYTCVIIFYLHLPAFYGNNKQIHSVIMGVIERICSSNWQFIVICTRVFNFKNTYLTRLYTIERYIVYT